MEIILITGPDGVGKSTLIAKLKEHQHAGTAFFLVPIANHQLTVADETLGRVLYFINWLYLEAESLKVPGLRALSLFAYMLVYKDLLADLEKQGKKLVVCDRHPLVDSFVYGKIYAPHIEPHNIPTPVLAEVDYNFNAQLFYLTKMLGLKKADMPKGACYHLSEFIYRLFLSEQKARDERLREIFQVPYPTHVLFLDINPEVLEDRLKNSKKQHTETRGQSAQLVEEFGEVVQDLPVHVERVDANDFGNLDRCAEKVISRYF